MVTDTHTEWTDALKDGRKIRIRPLTAGDEALEKAFIAALSPRSRRFRFLATVTPSDSLVHRLTTLDPKSDLALVALSGEGAGERAVGVARYGGTPSSDERECAVVVTDDWQRNGVGVALMRHLIADARDHGIRRLFSTDIAENSAMQGFARRLGFRSAPDAEDRTMVRHTLEL